MYQDGLSESILSKMCENKNRVWTADAEKELLRLKKWFPVPKSNVIKRHLYFVLLPSAAVYFAMQDNGMTEESAEKLIRSTVLEYYKPSAALYRTAGRLPHFDSIFSFLFPIFMKLYPESWWKITPVLNTKSEISFNMDRCFYFNVLNKCGCPELTKIFCDVDHLNFDNLSDKVKFVRTKTIGGGDGVCNFRFLLKNQR